MRCTSCGQTVPSTLPDGCCPLCGADLAARQSDLRQLYGLTGALFVSVLLYGGLVAYFESTGFKPVASLTSLQRLVLCLLPVLGLPIALVVQRELLRRGGPTLVRFAVVILATYCESIAIIGFVVYLLTADLRLFTCLLGVSVLGFGILAAKMPGFAARLDAGVAPEDESNEGDR